MSSADDPKIPTGSSNPDPERRRSPFRDRALALFYAVVIGVAMGGWLWFLGWLMWDLVTWIVNEITWLFRHLKYRG
jgi:uncharacterized membrane protein YccC